MYQLVTARYKLDRRSGRWVEADLAKQPITTLATTYGDVWLFVTYPSLKAPKALRLSSITNLLNGVTPATTVQQWLTNMGNTTLPWADKVPDFTVKLVEYCQAWHAGYHVETQGRSGTVADQLGASYRQDLLLTHPKFTPQKINDYCLFTVNGYFHLSDYTSKGVRIIDGSTTMVKGDDNQVGLYSFQQIGKIKTVPITPAMIHPMNDTAPLWDGAYINLPTTVDIENKTVLLVLGGYLQALGKVYQRVGDRSWKIEVGNALFLDRLIQSRKNLDLSSLKLESPKDNPSFAQVAQLKSDVAIKAYLTLTQSFFVVVDSPSFFQEFEPLEYSGLSSRYLGYQNQQLPVVGAYGRMLDYHLIEEDGTYVYCCTPNVRHNYDAGHRKWEQFYAVDDGRYPAHPAKEAAAFIRRLGTEGS